MSLRQRLKGASILAQSYLFGALSRLVPKQRGLVHFYPSFEPWRYGGNLRPVFEAMSDGPPQGRTFVWLTRSRVIADRLRAEGRRVHFSRWRPLATMLRAELIVLDMNEARLGGERFRMVQLWHGTGFKRISLETPGLSAGRLAAFRRHFPHYELIASTCEEDSVRKARCFENPNVEVLGSPRNDALLAPRAEAAALAQRLKLEGKRIVSYCPTFRDSRVARPFTGKGWRALDEALGRSGSLLLVKKHRFDRALSVPEELANVRDVSSEVGDVMDLLALTDVLVSDYSSIATDFVLTGRPMVFYTYDAEDYQARGGRLYYDLFETLPGPFARDEEELIRLVADTAWFDDPAYQERYDAFRKRFHQYVDAGSTARTVAAIERLLDGGPKRAAGI